MVLSNPGMIHDLIVIYVTSANCQSLLYYTTFQCMWRISRTNIHIIYLTVAKAMSCFVTLKSCIRPAPAPHHGARGVVYTVVSGMVLDLAWHGAVQGQLLR